MNSSISLACNCNDNTRESFHMSDRNVGAYPSFPACYGGMSLEGDNAGKFDAAQPFNTTAVCVPYTAESIWGNVMSAPAALTSWAPIVELSPLVFPGSMPEPAEPYLGTTCIFRPQNTGVYMIEVAAVLYAYYDVEQIGHSFTAHWGLVKGQVDTLKLITDISALPAAQLLPLAHHAGLSDSATPVVLHTTQLLKIGRYEEVALFAYFTSEDANTAGQVDIIVQDAPGFSVSPAIMQFVRVG